MATSRIMGLEPIAEVAQRSSDIRNTSLDHDIPGAVSLPTTALPFLILVYVGSPTPGTTCCVPSRASQPMQGNTSGSTIRRESPVSS